MLPTAPPKPPLASVRVEPLRDPKGQPLYVEAAPGERIIVLPASVVPRLALAEWQPAGDGTYRLVARRHDFFLAAPEAAKLLGLSYDTTLRLARAGFVASDRPAPRVVRIDLESFFRHTAAVQADPDFWNRRANLCQWQQAL